MLLPRRKPRVASWFELIRGTNERATPKLKRMKRKLFSRRRARFLLLAPSFSPTLSSSTLSSESLTRGIVVVFDHLKRSCLPSFPCPRLWQELNIIHAPRSCVRNYRVWDVASNERGGTSAFRTGVGRRHRLEFDQWETVLLFFPFNGCKAAFSAHWGRSLRAYMNCFARVYSSDSTMNSDGFLYI